MKVYAHVKHYKGTYKKEDGTEIPYAKSLLIVKDGNRYPYMISVPDTDETLSGKEIVVQYRKYGDTYKIAGYTVVNE